VADEGESKATRRLAAILAADVAGYSRLMGADEAGTLARLDACRALFRAHIEGRGGRVVDMAGDSVLAVFDSVVEAVAGAREVQITLTEQNAPLPEDGRMRWRIGVNLGDVLVKADGTVYGDGVNVAARLQSLAEPGGIVLSGSALEQVEAKLDLGFAFLGEQTVKNIARPVRAFRVVAAKAGSGEEAPPLPGKPSIAVLPFENMSGDPEQVYFADGIAEDLITALSRIRWLFVVARNSTFTYKGRALDVKQVGRELGVRYVVEGSVRRGGERVRVSVQLIDAATGNHVWAERYDRALEDIFALQEEITETMVAAIEPELGAVERERAHRKPPESLDAWEAYQRGWWHLFRFTPDDNLEARRLFREAIRRDRHFSSAHAGLAYGHYLAHVFGYPEVDLDEALSAGRQAVALDDRDALAHFALARVFNASHEHDSAIEGLEEAIRINPSFALAHSALGLSYCLTGRLEEGISEIDRAERLSPRDPALWTFESLRGLALALLGHLEEGLVTLRKATRRPNAEVWAFAWLAAILGHLGRQAEAQKAVEDLRRRKPDFAPDFMHQALGFTDRAHRDWLAEGLVKAGMPREGWEND
jgi:adenylate cyclase